MAPKRSDRRGRVDPPGDLAAVLAPHVDLLAAAAAQREAEVAAESEARERAERSRLGRLDEAALMQLIFAHLDDENPRVCVGIEFERLVVLTEVEVTEVTEVTKITEITEITEITKVERVSVIPPAPEVRAPPPTSTAVPRLTEHVWTGRGWIDDVQAIDPALLDRPELTAEGRALLERARARLLPMLNLRRLERLPALAHLDMFIHACRQQRVRFVRVITGKGIESRAEPVIKRAVLGWCQDRGLASAPELDMHGEWGTLIIELSR